MLKINYKTSNYATIYKKKTLNFLKSLHFSKHRQVPTDFFFGGSFPKKNRAGSAMRQRSDNDCVSNKKLEFAFNSPEGINFIFFII